MNEWKEFTGKTVDDALTEALIQLSAASDNVEYVIIEKESKGLLGMFSKPARIKVRKKELTVEEIVKNFLGKIFDVMNIKAEIEVNYKKDEDTVDINVIGDDMGVLIGKRGQTLDSLQYLTSLVINKNKEGYLKVKLDTENYRERRKETLENLAKNIAYKVKKTRKPVSLEPMNPYERRIIHSSLQNDKFVETHSEGEEPYRKVVIAIKKGTYDNRNYGGNKKYGRVNNKKDFSKKYSADSKDYSSDYKKDYAAYLEQKAAAKAVEASPADVSKK